MASSSYLSYNNNSNFRSTGFRDSFTPNKFSATSSNWAQSRPQSGYISSNYSKNTENTLSPSKSKDFMRYSTTFNQNVRDFSKDLDNIFTTEKRLSPLQQQTMSQYNNNTPSKSRMLSQLQEQQQQLQKQVSALTQSTSHFRSNSYNLQQQQQQQNQPRSHLQATPVHDSDDDYYFNTPTKSRLMSAKNFAQKENIYSYTPNTSASSRFIASGLSHHAAQNSQQYQSTLYSPVRKSSYQPQIVSNSGILPTNRTGKQYTLVLDLDETLTHTLNSYGPKIRFLKRPQVEEFLNEMSLYFEIVIFTAAMQEYADEIINQIDPYGKVSHRLYRQHLTTYRGDYIKDLSILGRDMKKTLIIDNLRSNFVAQPRNGYEIAEYRGQSFDTTLRRLARSLVQMVEQDTDDVRSYTIRA